MNLAEEIVSLEQTHQSQRSTWDSLWQDLGDLVHPRRGLITKTNPSTTAPDAAKVAANADGTAMRANRTLANGQASRITPMGARWFTLEPPIALKGIPAAVAWYKECAEILAAQLEASNFYNRATEHYLDRGAFGTAATEITASQDDTGLHFRSIPIGSFSIAENSNDEVDIIFRTYERTPDQLLQEFGKENLPKEILKTLEDPQKSASEKFCIIHAIRPRRDRDPRKTDAKNKAYQSAHILKKEKHVLRESGFDEFPVAVSRWETWGDSPYGWAPSYMALPEATQANFIEQMGDTLLELKAFPRVLYGSNLKGDIDFAALGLTCYDDASAPPQEWLTAGDYNAVNYGLEQKRQAIEDSFFVSLFSSVSNLRSDATATQVRALVGESRELFHPIFSGLTREFLGPVLRRSFAITFRQGHFPQPPEEVIQYSDLGAFLGDPSVNYVSSMALALQQSHMANFTDVIETLAPVAQNDPTAFDWLNTDVIGPEFARYKGLPESFIRSQDDIQDIRQQRAEQAQLEQAAALAQSLPDQTVQNAIDV